MAPIVLNSFEEMSVLSEGLQWNFVYSGIFHSVFGSGELDPDSIYLDNRKLILGKN
jgi:hypothetical protein